MRVLALAFAVGCSGDSELSWSVSMGDIAVLTRPGGGLLHSHATVTWTTEDHYVVAYAAGAEPAAQALAQGYDEDGRPAADATRLNAPTATGDKPDVGWDGQRVVTAWTDLQGRVNLAGLSSRGAISTIGRPLHQTDIRADAVDLAVRPSGAGIAVWTEFGGPGMGPEDGRIVWRAFDAELAAVGDAVVADAQSRKASDASALDDGGWVGVWALDKPHPDRPAEVIYEVWGCRHDADGSKTDPFRADDLDTAFPSRPAVAVRPDGSGAFAISWRDKVEADGPGLGNGAYVRLFDPNAQPIGPSVALDPGGDGDRVVVDWAGSVAVVLWQQTDAQGVPGVVLAAVDGDTAQIVVPPTWLSEAGGDHDERPSVSVRPSADGSGQDVLVVWEAVTATGAGLGLRARRVQLTSSS
ncbi:MAG: hypothetical protein KTR31_32530 [Myxococcales bacterium]|nr:hypothetical protein [Myxococcales bacterium]